MLVRYWTNIVADAEANADPDLEAKILSKSEAEWFLDGTLDGLHEIFPEKFNEDGTDAFSCEAADGTVTWGETECE